MRSFTTDPEQFTDILRTADLIDIEDLRRLIEGIVSDELCPTDGAVRRNFNQSCTYSEAQYSYPHSRYANRSWNSWPPDSFLSVLPTMNSVHGHEDFAIRTHLDLPVSQRRKMFMSGWGDEVSQYYIVESMMKLNPAQIMHLHEHTVTKPEIERWLLDHIGEEWFWENGQTWLDTWMLVVHKRGENPDLIREAIIDGQAGVANANTSHWSDEDDTCF